MNSIVVTVVNIINIYLILDMVEKRGGFQKKIDFDKIIELSSPYRRNMDCCHESIPFFRFNK